MFRSSFRRTARLSLLLMSYSACSALASSPRPAQQRAISRALTRELNHATPDHVRVARFALTSVDVQGHWALADVKPLGSGALDPVFVLVHKRWGAWNFVTMGGNLRGSGQQFKIPHALWKRWNL